MIGEKNKLIAEFMQIEFAPEYIQDGYDMPMAFKDGTYQPIQYHTSWDWLMPVVDKIRDLGFEVNLQHQLSVIKEPRFIERRFEKDFTAANVKNRDENVSRHLHGAYNVVIEFIEWYNTNPPINPII